MFNGIAGLSREIRGSYFVWTYDGKLSEIQASDLQQLAGFHSSGYGFFSHKIIDGITKWESMRSCD